MPRVDANVHEATVGRWLVERGQRLRAGQPMVEIITDKAEFDLEAEQDGILLSQVAPEKSIVPVGYVLALVGDEAAGPLPDVEAENSALMAAYRQALIAGGPADAAEPTPGPTAPPSPNGGAVEATPAARRLAARSGVDLVALAARVGGVVRRRHVEEEIARREASR
jgi:pyruvate/2-oxoglutarate dehydrogenase complex dihydrolipoamide acyltransferase (E2) component